VADGGESFYVEGDHRVTVPNLHRASLAEEKPPRDKNASDKLT
jgi:hypothetical protein